jgi:hypothetical protein
LNILQHKKITLNGARIRECVGTVEAEVGLSAVSRSRFVEVIVRLVVDSCQALKFSRCGRETRNFDKDTVCAHEKTWRYRVASGLSEIAGGE